jgi:hypothetical protein
MQKRRQEFPRFGYFDFSSLYFHRAWKIIFLLCHAAFILVYMSSYSCLDQPVREQSSYKELSLVKLSLLTFWSGSETNQYKLLNLLQKKGFINLAAWNWYQM